MASGNDMKMAESTYGGFISMVKWGTVACALIAAFVVFLISR
jgi:hypothetical protein